MLQILTILSHFGAIIFEVTHMWKPNCRQDGCNTGGRVAEIHCTKNEQNKLETWAIQKRNAFSNFHIAKSGTVFRFPKANYSYCEHLYP